MIKHLSILSISVLTLMMLPSCGNGEFKQTRAEMLERQKQRKLEYQAQKKLEEEEKARMEAEALAKARVEAERAEKEAAAEAAPIPPAALMQDSLLFHFERRPCFGRCPVYKIKIYESGYTTYDGVNFVDYMGYFQHKLDPTEIAMIYKYIAEADFFELEDSYDNENIMDLPSMIFRARAMGQDKRIVARYEIPEALTNLASKIDDMFEETEWKPVSH